MSSRPAVLFDIDGTLIDSNYFHALAWWRTLRDAGEDVPMSTIHPLIGMGSDQLLTTVLGEERPGLSEEHARHFRPFKPELRAFPKASELLQEVDRRGGQVVLVTSSKEEDLDDMLKAIGADDAIDEIVHGDDVDRSKPSPDMFSVALEKLGLDRERSIVVGDTIWDVQAAGKVGLRCVAVLTGGTTRHHLEEAGAVAVYHDAADLLNNLDDSPLGELLRR